MEWLIDLAVKAVLFGGMLFLLDRFFKDFRLSKGGIVPVTLILLVINMALGLVLRFVAFPFKLITLGLLSWLINWAINVIIIKVTDKFSDQLEIGSTMTLLISGAALSTANIVYHWIV